MSVRLSILSTPYRPAHYAMLYYLSRGILPCCKSLHQCVVNTNCATWSVCKQAEIAYWPAGLADNVLNDCKLRVVSSGLSDIRTVAWSDADKKYVFGTIDATYLAKLMK